MSTPPTQPIHLGQLRKQAKDLLASHKASDAAAARRLVSHHPRFRVLSEVQAVSAQVTLSDAQLVVAREQGFASWPQLKHHCDAETGVVTSFHRPLEADLEWYEGRARGFVSMHQGGLPQACSIIRQWRPAYAHMSDEAIRASTFTLDDSRLVYARQHGFDTWDGFAKHIESLNAGSVTEPLRDALLALKEGDIKRFKAVVRGDPTLVSAVGSNGNSLLNLATGLGKADAIRFLIARGADVNFPNDRGYTPLHSAAYAGRTDLCELLIHAGGSVESYFHGDGGTPLVAALFWGKRETADFLVQFGIVPNNLRVAAGIGRTDLVRSHFESDGRLASTAGAHRGFYRPHSGFPAWTPSDDPQEILDEALVYAAKNARHEAMDVLLNHGANINGDPYRGTALIWAAASGLTETVRWLLDHGADPSLPATFGGPSHGEGITAMHLAAQSGHLDVVRVLFEHGADTTVEDTLYHGTPYGHACHFEQDSVRDYLRSVGAE